MSGEKFEDGQDGRIQRVQRSLNFMGTLRRFRNLRKEVPEEIARKFIEEVLEKTKPDGYPDVGTSEKTGGDGGSGDGDETNVVEPGTAAVEPNVDEVEANECEMSRLAIESILESGYSDAETVAAIRKELDLNKAADYEEVGEILSDEPENYSGDKDGMDEAEEELKVTPLKSVKEVTDI